MNFLAQKFKILKNFGAKNVLICAKFAKFNFGAKKFKIANFWRKNMKNCNFGRKNMKNCNFWAQKFKILKIFGAKIVLLLCKIDKIHFFKQKSSKLDTLLNKPWSNELAYPPRTLRKDECQSTIRGLWWLGNYHGTCLLLVTNSRHLWQ